MSKRTAWILAAGVAAMALGAAAVGVLVLVWRGPEGTRGARGGTRPFLHLALGGEIPEQPSSEINILERRPPTLRHLVDAIDRAAGDPKVGGLLLEVGMMSDAGWGKVQELRDAVLRFRKSGKPSYAHLEFCTNKEYYLASAAAKVSATPASFIVLTGLETEVTFFRGTLDKVGVEAQFEGVGKYKNAPDQFTERGFTEPHREQMEALLDSLHGSFVEAIASSRGKTKEEVQALLDGGPYHGTQALAAGLLDEVLYADQVEDKVGGGTRLPANRYLRSARRFGFETRPKVALVYVVGEIVGGRSVEGPFGTFAGSDTVAGALRRAREDDDIKGIVLRVDSPGGSGTASEVIWREVQLARRSKPVVVSFGDVAASGGYYVAMGADAIVAQPGTITGSIGVFSGKFNLHGLYDKLGITKELLLRGRRAAIFSEYRPWNEDERARIRELNVAFYEDFVKRAAEGRRQSYEALDAVAQGRVWTGVEARRHGLVDRLGGLDAALDLVRERAGLGKGRDVAVVVLPERRGLLETIFERQEEGAPEEALPRDVRALWRFARVLGSGDRLARLPFDLRVR